MFAAIIIAIIPTIIVYSMFSNQIVDGLTAGAVKGQITEQSTGHAGCGGVGGV